MVSGSLPRSTVVGVWMILLGAVFSSSKAVIIKLAYEFGVNAESLLALRMLAAFPFFLVMGVWSLARIKKRLRLKDWAQVAFVGLLGYYLASLFDFIGLQYITAGLERLILFAYPTLVLLMAWLIWKRPISKPQWGALILTYIGIVLVLQGNIQIPDPRIMWKGVAWVFLCAVAYAGHLLGSEKLIPRMGVMIFSSWAMIAASIGVLLHALVKQNSVQMTDHPEEVYWLTLLLAVVTTVLPPYLMSGGIARLGAGNAGIIASIGPVSTLVLAWWFLGETLSGMQLMGAAVVLAGILLISRKKAKRKSDP